MRFIHAHLVEPASARTHAFGSAIAAVVAATDKALPDQGIDELLESYEIADFEVGRAKAWLQPLFEVVQEAPPLPRPGSGLSLNRGGISTRFKGKFARFGGKP